MQREHDMQFEGLELVDPEGQVFAPLLAQWHRNRDDESLAPSPPLQAEPYVPADAGWLGASKLGGCTRAIGYTLSGAEAEPMDEAGFYATGVGTLFHQAIQAEVVVRPPEGWDVAVEVPWSLPECNVMSKADLVSVDERGDSEVADIKTMAQFGFKMHYSEGVKREHVLQVGLAMKAMGAMQGRLVYLSPAPLVGRDIPKGSVRGDRATRQSEWTFSWEAVEELVEAEIRRLNKIHEYLDAGKELPRYIPGSMPRGSTIVELPAKGGKGVWNNYVADEESGQPVMMAAGESWQCGWCNYLEVCRDEMPVGGDR